MSANLCALILLLYQIAEGSCQDDEGPYKGKYIGKLNSYHHQVSGDVYAVDEYTILLVGFNYDGNGADTFFWSGAANRPGPQGFIVPDENGKTNVLERYFNKEFTLTLPDKKKITDIKWFAIYDLWSQNTFGDIYIPEEFEPPTIQRISQITAKSNKISSGSIEIIDSKTLRLPEFRYDGKAKRAHFWVGVGPQPTSKGSKVPDEYGYVDPIRAYKGETITLIIPGDMTIFNIDWFSVFDLETNTNLGSIIIPDGLNVPPSLVKVTPHKNDLPNCLQLHKDFQASWEIFGPQITIQLAGQIKEDEYLAFGLSGAPDKSQMLGADAAVAYIDGYLLEQPANTLSWYINGYLAPEIWLRRGLTYAFKVKGGNNPHSAEHYHPLIITDEPHGGYDKLTDDAQSNVRVLAGVEYSRRGRPRPTAAGPLCLSQHRDGQDRRLDDTFSTFKKFNKSLTYSCEEGAPAILEITPNSTWPDIVYYNSFTQSNMGWKIHVVDTFSRSFVSEANNVAVVKVLIPIVILGRVFL